MKDRYRVRQGYSGRYFLEWRCWRWFSFGWSVIATFTNEEDALRGLELVKNPRIVAVA